MKTIPFFLILLLTMAAQAQLPPLLRSQLTTNATTGTLDAGEVPQWNGTHWAFVTAGGASTNVPTTITTTNFVLNQVYTNGAQVALLRAIAELQTAAVAGSAALDLMADQAGGTTFTLLGRVEATTTIALNLNVTNDITGVIATNGTYYFTNSSTGIGNSSTLKAGQIAYFGGNGAGSSSSTGTNFASAGITNFFRFFPQTNALAGAGTTNLVIDGNQAALVRCTPGANFGVLFTNLIDGQEIEIEIKQDATGIRTCSFPYSNFRDPATDIPIASLSFSTNANYIDALKVRVRGTNAFLRGFVRGYTE